MKHLHLILAGFLLCPCCTLQAKDRTADRSPFIVSNTVSTEASNTEQPNQWVPDSKKVKYTIHQVDENVSNEDLFASIIGKFKGRVLLVDFWATWCGPCRMANKEMIPVKEELEDKGIAYLYITGEISPLKDWENMIPDIHGEHFRLTDAQWKYLSGVFNIKGVPTYLIVDREGNIRFRQTGFPGAKEMKEELMETCGLLIVND